MAADEPAPLTETNENQAPGLGTLGLIAAAVAALYALTALTLAATSKLTAVVHIHGHTFALQQIHELFFRFSLIGLGVVPGIMLLEIVVIGWRRSSLRELLFVRSKTIRSDAVCFLLGHLRLMRWPQIIMTFGFTLISGMVLHDWIRSATGVNLTLDGIPAVPRIALCYLIYTFLDYWAHRIDHSPIMWPLHRFHHAAEDFVVLTAARGHPGAALTQLAIKTLPMATIGMSMVTIIDLTMFVAATNYFIHSRLPLRLGLIGQWVIQSPPHHRVHHIRVWDGKSWNYSICPLWDRLFGTWRDAPEQPVEIGIEYDYHHGAWVVRDMLRDYVEFLRGVVTLPFRRRAERPAQPAAEPPERGMVSTMIMPASSISVAPMTPVASLEDNAPSPATLVSVEGGPAAQRFDDFLAMQPAPANNGLPAE